MNNAFMVKDVIPPSQQKSGCTAKKSEQSDAFASALAEMMQEGSAQVSVTQVQVTQKSLLESSELILPNNQSLKELSERLDYMLDLLFVRNGIPKDPAVEVELSYTRTEVTVTGERDDIDEINRLINQNTDITEQIRTTLAIASHVINMAESLAFQNEYRNSSDPESVVSRYSYLFDDNRQMHTPSIRYGENIEILSDGKTYSL